jgi:hypothetical protein
MTIPRDIEVGNRLIERLLLIGVGFLAGWYW